MSLAALLAAIALWVPIPSSSTVPPPRRAADPVPVRLFLDQARYAPGADGQVRVVIGEDGYLVVLYANPDGHVSIAYPIDPGLSDRVRADTQIEILSRGGRAAFTIDDSSGSGTWYAAISEQPFRLDSVAVNGHWDYRNIPRVDNPNAVESVLTAFVKTIARSRFDYDIVGYTIDTAAARTSSAGSAPPPRGPSAARVPWTMPGIWGPGPWSWPGWIGPWAGPYYDRSLPTVALVSHEMQLARGPDPEATPPALHGAPTTPTSRGSPTAPATRAADGHDHASGSPKGESKSGGSSGAHSGGGSGKAGKA